MTRPLRTLALQVRDHTLRPRPSDDAPRPQAELTAEELATGVLGLEMAMHVECRLLAGRIHKAVLAGDDLGHGILSGQFCLAVAWLQAIDPSVTAAHFLPEDGSAPSPAPAPLRDRMDLASIHPAPERVQ